MKSYGDSIDDDQIVEKVLISILAKFDLIVVVIENKKISLHFKCSRVDGCTKILQVKVGAIL